MSEGGEARNHEAGIPRWTIYKHSGQWDDVIEGPDTGDEHDSGIEVVPAAYLSRCPFPERCLRCGRTREDIRDGEGCGDYEHCPGVLSSPERDTEKLVEALQRIADQDAAARPGVEWKHWRAIAREALAEFSSTTKEQ